MSLLDRLIAWTRRTRAGESRDGDTVDSIDTMGSIATIDAAKAAPPPSPLAPVDLTDPAQVAGVMDIAARIGAILISSGTSNADSRAQIYLAASAYGLHYCHIDILTNTVTVHTNIGVGEERRPLHIFRVAPPISLNFDKLSKVDKLIRSIHSGTMPPSQAEKELDKIENMSPPISTLTTLIAWGLMGGFFSILLGGGAFVAGLSFFVAMFIMSVNTWLGRFRLPLFYQNVIGGFLAVLPAAFMYHFASYLDVSFSPSQVIGMSIVVLVAGLTLVQCIVDGITGAPVTSAARFFEALLATGAIVAGVGMGIQFVGYIGFDLPPLATVAPPVYHEVPLLILAGALGSAAFAYACYANLKETTIAGLTAASGMVIYYMMIVLLGIGGVISSAIASIAVGLAGGLLSRRFFIPPLVTMIVGYTPMLPGLTLYRGMYATLNDQTLTGFTNLAKALAIAGALAAGVVLGERVARRLRSPNDFHPYATFRKLTRQSFRIPRVPLSPFAPHQTRPVPPPVQEPRMPEPEELTTQWPAIHVKGSVDWEEDPHTPTVYTSPGTGEWPKAQNEDQ